MRTLLGVAVTATVLVGCSATVPPPVVQAPPTEIPPALELPPRPTGEAWRALALVPAEAAVVTLTDYDAIRARFGVPEMTSADPKTARAAFWARTRRDAVLLDEGVLTEARSRFWLDHGFTRDDVDWEVRFSGPGGEGYVVAFRPDLDMRRVERAVGDEAAAGSTVMAAEHLLVKGAAEAGELVWAADPLLPDLTDDTAESAYLRRGCLPVRTALGNDATYDDSAVLIGELDPRNLAELGAFSVSFGDGLATARLGEERDDLVERGRITEAWPVITTAPGFTDGFRPGVQVDPSTGRVGLTTTAAHAAAAVTLNDLLPFAICNDLPEFEEPSGR